MSTWNNTDLSSGPPSYQEFSQNYQSTGDSTRVSDSPHQSDDEETVLLKEELRRLRERNQPDFYTLAAGYPTSASNLTPSRSSSTTRLQYTSQGPVYQHPVVTTAVPNTTANNHDTSSENSNDSCGQCFKMFLYSMIALIFIVIVLLSIVGT